LKAHELHINFMQNKSDLLSCSGYTL